MSSESGVALCSFHICTYCPCDIPTTTLVPLPSYMVNWPTNLLKNDGDDHDQRHVCSTKFLQNNASPPSATQRPNNMCMSWRVLQRRRRRSKPKVTTDATVQRSTRANDDAAADDLQAAACRPWPPELRQRWRGKHPQPPSDRSRTTEAGQIRYDDHN